MVSVPSTELSLHEDTTDVPVIHHRIVQIDASRFRLQVQHFEYYWGLNKGKLDLDLPLNHVDLRSDMVQLLNEYRWTPMPTWQTLKRMLAMAKFNKTADLHLRKNYLQEFPGGEFEYDFVPTGMAKYGRPTVYVHDAAGCKAFDVPYKGVPRISRPTTMPCMKAKRRIDAMMAIISSWEAQPPKNFLVGPDVWREHRHPLSDDGHAASSVSQRSRAGNSAKVVRPRKVTKAPCLQTKATTGKTPYTRCDRLRTECWRRSVVPRFDVHSEGGTSGANGGFSVYDAREVIKWSSSIRRLKICSLDSAWLDSEAHADPELAAYQREASRSPADALRPRGICSGGSLVYGDSEDKSTWSSNDWAMRTYGSWLWSSKSMQTFPFHSTFIVLKP